MSSLSAAEIPQALAGAISDEVRAALEPQPAAVHGALLKLLRDVPEALSVVRDIPSLGGLLALYVDEAEERAVVCAELREALRRPRNHLLPLVGLPARRSLLRLLAKLEPRAIVSPGPKRIIAVLTSSEEPVRRWLQHLPRIRADVLYALALPRIAPLCTYELLADQSRTPIPLGLHMHLRRVELCRELGTAPRTPARFRSRRELFDFCRALPDPRLGSWYPAEFPRPFDTPTGEAVLPGAPEVRLTPVRTAAEMHAHAVEGDLCIARDRSYPERAGRGDGALYVARWAEDGGSHEATVWIRWLLLRGWALREATLSGNRTAPRWLTARLEAWARGIEDQGPGPQLWIQDHQSAPAPHGSAWPSWMPPRSV